MEPTAERRELDELMNRSYTYAVVGASNNREKFGNRVYRTLRSIGLKVYPINPAQSEIEGDVAYPTISSTPVKPDVVVLVVPPAVGEKIVREACELKVKGVWVQIGAESDALVDAAKRCGLVVVHGGPCIMVYGLMRFGAGEGGE
ncbi:MAG: CoA-binding protein [Methermicoccaceae archaeon]